MAEFFASEDGDRYLQNDTTIRPIHIIADFNYVPINFDLNENNQEGKKDSMIAKTWRRNVDSRIWRDWVGNCLAMESFFGPEIPTANSPDGRTYRPFNGGLNGFDKTAIGLNLDSKNLRDFSKKNKEFLEDLGGSLGFFVNFYENIFTADEAFLQTSLLSPFINQQSRGKFESSFGEYVENYLGTNIHATYPEVGNFYSRFKNFIATVVTPAAFRNEDGGYYGGKLVNEPYFRFTDSTENEHRFYFGSKAKTNPLNKLKSESQILRHINNYIENNEFVTLDSNEDDLDYRRYSEVSSVTVSEDQAQESMHSSANSIRRNIIDSIVRQKDIVVDDIADIKTIQNKLVITKGNVKSNGEFQDVVNDDIQKLLSRPVMIEKNKSAFVIEPYLYEDFAENFVKNMQM